MEGIYLNEAHIIVLTLAIILVFSLAALRYRFLKAKTTFSSLTINLLSFTMMELNFIVILGLISFYDLDGPFDIFNLCSNMVDNATSTLHQLIAPIFFLLLTQLKMFITFYVTYHTSSHTSEAIIANNGEFYIYINALISIVKDYIQKIRDRVSAYVSRFGVFHSLDYKINCSYSC